jgi:hypothetical protein
MERSGGSGGRLLRALLASALVLAFGACTAHASFPGENGKIVLEKSFGIHVVEPDGTGLSPKLADGRAPEWSPDGRRIAFIGTGTQIRVMNADGTANALVATPAVDYVSSLAWSHDGTRLALATVRLATPTQGVNDIQVLDIANGSLTNITSNGEPCNGETIRQEDNSTNPDWDPKGNRIAYAHRHDTYPFEFTCSGATCVCSLNLIGADGGGSAPLATSTVDNGFLAPSWSPDGAAIAMQRLGNDPGLYRLDLDGTQTKLNASGGRPSWSPDGTKIAVLSTGADVYLMDADGTDMVRITNEAADISWIDWQPLPPAVAITSGPTGTVATRAASFAFLLLDATPPPGDFECRVDGADFAPCTSPHALTVPADGQHTFEVRFHEQGQTPGPAAKRTWTVDTVAPVVTIGARPPPEGNGPAVTVEFGANEPANFLCSDDGAPVQGCASPRTLTGLADGEHSLAVMAIDVAGNESAVERVSWLVGEVCAAPAMRAVGAQWRAAGCPVAPPTCVAPRLSKVVLAVFSVVARGGPESCLEETQIAGRRAYVSSGPVTLNGIDFVPAAGQRVRLIQNLGQAVFQVTGAGARMQLGPIPVNLDPDFEISSELGNAPVRIMNLLDRLPRGDPVTLFGVQVKAAPTVEFGFGEGGSAKVGLKLGLPTKIFGAAPGGTARGAQGLTIELLLKASNNFGANFAGKASLGEAWLLGKPGARIKDLSIGVDTGQRLFEVGGTMEMGPAVEFASPRQEPLSGGRRELRLELALGSGGFLGWVRKLVITGSKLNQPFVHPALFIQKAGLELRRDEGTVNAVRLLGQVEVSIGPVIPILAKPMVTGFGELEIKWPLSDAPTQIQLLGVGSVVDIPIGVLIVRNTMGESLSLQGNLDLSIGGYGALFEIRNSFFTPDGGQLEGATRAALPGLGSSTAEGIVSDRGFVVCSGSGESRIGWGRYWFAEDAVKLVGGACDLQLFRSLARSAQAGAAAPASISVPAGRRLLAIEAAGRDAAPKVVVSGPGGLRLETPADAGGVKAAGRLLWQDPARKVTTIVLTAPRAGRYTVAPVAGAEAPISVRSAENRPAPKVSVRLRRRGARRVMTWNLRRLPGQRVVFAERGRVGAVRIATTTRARGRVTFTPSPTAGGRRRTIVAQVIQDDLPRKTLVVARYTVADRLVRVRGLTRRSGTLRWRAQTPAARYSVVIAAPGGVVTTHTVTGAALRLRAALRRAKLTVTVRALDALDRPGPSATFRLRAEPAPQRRASSRRAGA